MRKRILIALLFFPLTGDCATPLGTATNPPVVQTAAGTFTIQTGVTTTFNSGSITTFASGSTVNFNGTVTGISTSVSTGKTLWVDSVNGNNSTAVSGRLDKPYLTVAAAKTAASSGDTIDVWPGTYEGKNLFKTGVNWNLRDGAIIQNTLDSTVGVFDDSSAGANGAVTCSISGRGVVKMTTATASANTVNITNASSNIVLNTKEIYTAGTSNSACIRQTNGTLRWHVDKFSDSGAGIGVWWDDGENIGDADEIRSGGIAIYGTPNVTLSNMYVTVHGPVTSATGAATIQMAGTEVGSKMWIESVPYIGHLGTLPAISVSANKLYVSGAQKTETVGSGDVIKVSGSNSATLWFDGNKVTSNGGKNFAMAFGSHGTAYLNVQNWECLANNTAAISVASSFATVHVSGGVLNRASTTGDGVSISSGAIYVSGMPLISTSGGSYYDLKQTGGTLSVSGSTYTTTSGTITQGDPYWATFPGSTAITTLGTIATGTWNGSTIGTAYGGTGITAFGTGVATALGINVGSAGAFVTNGGAFGTPSSGTLTNATGLPITGITSSTSAQLRTLLSDENGTGAALFSGATSPAFITPDLGTPSALVVTNASGTASININGTVGATTPTTAAVTSETFTLSLKSTTALATPSALSATQWTGFASTVSGAAIMGYGTTNDVALMNRAGTVVLGVGPNTTVVNIPGSLTIATPLAVAQGGTGASSASITAFNNITGFTAAGTTGTTSTNLVFSASPTFSGTPILSTTATATAISGPSTTDLTLNGGSTGTALVIGQGTNGGLTNTMKGTGVWANYVNGATSVNSSLISASDFFRLVNPSGSLGFAGVVCSSDASTDRFVFKGVRARGTPASPTIVSAGDSVFSLLGAPFDGTSNRATAEILFLVETPVSGTSVTQSIDFLTAPDGISRASAMRIFSDKSVSIGNTTSTGTAGKLSVTGGITTAGSMTIGGGTAIAKVMSATATLDFGSTLAGGSTDLTITVTGAALGDIVTIGVPNASVPAGGAFFGWVSAADTVSIRYGDNSLVTTYDPASGTFRATVTHF